MLLENRWWSWQICHKIEILDLADMIIIDISYSWSCFANFSNCLPYHFCCKLWIQLIFFSPNIANFGPTHFLQDLPIDVLGSFFENFAQFCSGSFFKKLQYFTIGDDDEHCKIVPLSTQPVNLLKAVFRNNICHGEGSVQDARVCKYRFAV